MANNHPDAPKQFGIHLREEAMEVVSEIQLYRQRTNQTITLTPIGEDAIHCHYNLLANEDAIKNN